MDRRMKEEEEEDIFYSPENMEASDNEENGRNDEDEKTMLSHLRATLEKQDPSCKEIDDLTLRRFLRARDLDVEKASRMFIKYLTWRRSFVPKGSISVSEIINQLNDNKIYMQGTDTRGCPVLVVFGAKHFPSKGGTEELKRLVVFAFDKLCSRIPDGQEKLTIIVDLQGYGYSNSDVRGYTAILSILQEYYPERLGKVFMIHVPYIFMTVWKIIYPFIDKNTKKKFVFIESKKLREALLEEINESQLPDIYGGKLKLVPIQDST
ncbi:hypothetical protein ABFS82_04G116000 [Erythranthe guttata]|uniref:CRAL-TRIO domain-containing protein n=1 Tax=Erythranthe guttata TaxID=4155 RepID=A0A022QBC4_ERYGU|nr:PREDICTED: sec14 cytosolic factor-like [Erythranthe guttata]EYU24533.1 hypothetical protein MIMGU_mgv1a012016mg [Erythranthe guttata]|eukprot:XP_012852637.1 PREDICTED: sec14 cytosolic factor-like [Erythranthe guttata]